MTSSVSMISNARRGASDTSKNAATMSSRERVDSEELGNENADDFDDNYFDMNDYESGKIQPGDREEAAASGDFSARAAIATKKAKKNLRNTISRLQDSRFADWNRQELVMLLVKRGVELRGEATIAYQTLVDMADEAYFGERMPEKPPNFTIWELLKVSWAIAKVQDKWIEKTYNRRIGALEDDDAVEDIGNADSERLALRALREMEEKNDDAENGEAFPGIENFYPGDDNSGLNAANHDEIHAGRSQVFREGDNKGINLTHLNHKQTDTVKDYFDKARPVSMITQAMHTPWAGPDWEKARQHADYTNPRRGGKGGKPFSFFKTTTGRYCCLSGCGEQCDIFREGQTSEFGIFGSGVSSYFKFLKWLIGLFALLTIFSLPLVTINYFGRAYDLSETRDWRDLARPSLGNLLPAMVVNTSDPSISMGVKESYIINSTTIVVISVPLCIPTEQYLSFFEGPDPDLDCVLGKDTVATYYMWMDIIICCAVFIAYLWLKYFEDAANRKMEAFTVYASMYTVQMKNLGDSCNEQDIKTYIQKLIGTQPKHKVASVNIAFDNLSEIRNCTLRGDLVREKITKTSVFRYKVHELKRNANKSIEEHKNHIESEAQKAAEDQESGTATAPGGNRSDHRKTKKIELEVGATKRALTRQIKSLEQEFRIEVEEIDGKIASLENTLRDLALNQEAPIVAYVTFNTVAGAEKFLEAHRSQQKMGFCSWVCNGFKSKAKTINGKVPRLKPAPEPSTILWENIRYGKLNCFIRRSLVTLAALGCIAVSLLFTLASKYIQDGNASVDETSTMCPTNFYDISSDDQRSLVRGDVGLTHCYCDDIPFYRRRNDTMCTAYFDRAIRNLLIGYAAVFVVVGLNASLGGILTRFANFEKHHTEELRMKSAFDRLFILKYINTSLVFLLSNNDTVLTSIKNVTGFDGVSTAEFSRDWYTNIGITLLLVQMGNIFGGHIVKFIQLFTMKYRLWRANRDPAYAITQDHLNKLHEGPQFRFAENYAQLMSTFYGCMTFNLGIPLLNWIGLANCILFYFIDKYFFIHVCCSPARLNIRLSRRVRSLIPGAILVHLLMALWTLSNDDIFVNTWQPEARHFSNMQTQYFGIDLVGSVNEKLYQSHMFPIMLLIVCAIGLKVMLIVEKHLRVAGVFRFFGSFFSTGAQDGNQNARGGLLGATRNNKDRQNCRTRFISFAQKLLRDDGEEEELTNIAKTVSYPRAVQRNLIKGLATYNILHNPKYKEQFAITWKFAMRHRHVRSVVLYDTVTDVLSHEHEKDADAKRTEKLRRASALPMMTQRDFQLKLERQGKNKAMLKMVQDETRRRAVGMLGNADDGEETKEDGDRISPATFVGGRNSPAVFEDNREGGGISLLALQNRGITRPIARR